MMQREAIVVGGGIAGLTAAAYLAREGMDVLLLEKNDRCGGLVHSFVRDGFLFEGGVRAIVDAGIVRPMLRDLGAELEAVRSPVSVGIEDRIIHVESEENLRDYQDLLKALYPESHDDVDRLISVVRRVMRDMKVLYGVDNPVFNDFQRDRSYFVRVYLPWLFKFLLTLRNINRMRMPVEAFLTPVVRNRSLRDIVTQHFFRNVPAFFALSYFYLYTDYIYPRGGVQQLAEKVKEKILEFGGEIRTGVQVVDVDAAQRVLRDQEGNLYAYEDLIWAADLKTLYRSTHIEGLPAEAVEAIETEKERILSRRGADSVFTVYIGVDEPPETFRQISHGHFFYTPSRKGLGETHRSELKELLRNWSNRSREEVLQWLDQFCRFDTYEISIPVLRDPAAAPEGKTGLVVSTLFEYDLVRKTQEDGWYQEFREEVARRMIDVLSSTVYPMIRDKILFHFSASPLTIEKEVGSSEGAIVGWSFEEPVPVTTSFLRINDAVKTTIPHIFKAGQWAYSPTGVPTSILTGKIAADTILRQRRARRK